jgi:hypothetical protein
MVQAIAERPIRIAKMVEHGRHGWLDPDPFADKQGIDDFANG